MNSSGGAFNRRPAGRPIVPIEVKRRAPLKSFPPVTASGSKVWAKRPYRSTLPFTPPPKSVDFYRANFCGMRLPGAPYVEGASSDDPSLIMTCLIDRYPIEIQQEFWKRYAEAGYTHGQRSIGHSCSVGSDGLTPEVGNKLTPDQFVEIVMLQRQYGLFIDIWGIGGPGFRFGQRDASYWGPRFDPYLDALIAAKAIDTACVGWQLDGNNTPGGLKSIINYFADRLRPLGIRVSVHWLNDANAWFDDFEYVETAPGQWERTENNRTPPAERSNFKDRFDFWAYFRDKLTDTHFQGDVNAPIDDYQENISLVMKALSDQQKVIVFETSAQAQFNGQQTEDEGDLKYYLICCTVGERGQTVGGYGNGARMPNGDPL